MPVTEHENESVVKVLLIEDDATTAAYLTTGLREVGIQVVHADDGATGQAAALKEGFDVAVIDRMLPGLDGVTLVRSLRAAGWSTPILFLTTMSGIEDRVDGLEAGGDDYLVKPFAFVELLARLNALTRRAHRARSDTILQVGDLQMDLIARKVQRAGRAVELLPREFQLLEFLIRNAGSVVTRQQLLESVWNFHFIPQTNIVETHMSRLRGKVDRGFGAELIETVRGIGYVLRAD